jgi:hypothetical protein
MDDLSGIASPLNVLVSCAQRAVEFEPGSPPYMAELHSAERAVERAAAQARRLTKGQPKHRKSVRTVALSIEIARECLQAISVRASPDELMRRSGAVQRAVARIGELSLALGRQTEECRGEVVVSKRPWTSILDVPNDLLSAQSGEPIEHDAGDEAAAVASLSAGDEHALAAQE